VSENEDSGVTTTGIAVDPPLGSAHIVGNNLFITRNAIVNIKQQGMTGFDTHVDYGVTVPNIIGYPEHKRCLMMVRASWAVLVPPWRVANYFFTKM
jgi:hypothetical protein